MSSGQDSVCIRLSGVRPNAPNRGGVPSVHVDELFSLDAFMEQYGSGGGIDKVDLDFSLYKGDTATLKAKLAEAAEAVAAGEAGNSKVDSIHSAVLKYLEERGVVLSEEDPGDDVWYMDPRDLTCVELPHKGDGTMYLFAAATPFGQG